MAEKALFFNALPDAASPTGYDRNYNADDISDWLDVMFTTGVVKNETGLKVTATGGMNVSVNVGKAVINGKPYRNDAVKVFTIDTAPTGSTSRVDLIVLRFDRNTSVRNTYLAYKKGTGATVPALERTDLVYELALAKITVAPAVTTISAGAIADLRGDHESVVVTTTGRSLGFCPYLTAAKGYDDYYDAAMQTHESTVAYATNPVITDLPSALYNEKYSFIEVYTNGIKETETAYSASVSGGYVVITFTTAKAAGAKITVVLHNFIDGEGMSTALAQYTQLLQDVTDLKAAGEYDYICNGVNDNVLIGDIVRAYLNGGTDYGSMKLNVYGNIGISTPASGSGTSVSPYRWFDFNVQSNRKIIIDFSSSGQIAPPITGGKYNSVFITNSAAEIIGANVTVSQTAADTVVIVSEATGGAVLFKNCRFWVTAYRDSKIAMHGTFENCRGSVANVVNNSYCFLPSTNGLVRIIGGEYYAYCGSGLQSSIVGQSGANSVSILYGVNAPTIERNGFYQTHSLLQWAGGGVLNCTDLISALPMIVVSGISNIRGTIAMSKAGAM